MDPIKHYALYNSLIMDIKNPIPSIRKVVAARVVDIHDKAIVDAVIKVAHENGFTDLWLLDGDFVMEALTEKLERMKKESIDD